MSCLICEMTANGQHFGVRCCRACAAFFRRTLTMDLRYKCRFEKKCEVVLRKRYSCRFCRFEKCLRTGMRRDMVQGKSEVEIKLEDKDSSGDTDSIGQSPLSSVESAYSATTPLINYSSPDMQPNISFHRSVIEEVGKAVLPVQMARREADYLTNGSENGSSKSAIFALAAAQATQDLHVNVQHILTPAIDALFTKKHEEFYAFSTIPLTMCQQALLAYQEHNRQWPMQDILIESRTLDMDLFMRNHYLEIEHIARFCMSIRAFALLPKDQKWVIFKNFWTRFYELDRVFTTCKKLGHNLNDERCVCLSGQVINFGISVVKLELISDMDADQVKNFLKGSHDKFRQIFTNPFKKLQPTEYELMYMMMSIMWSVRSLPGVAEDTIKTAERAEMRLAEDLHNYYCELHESPTPNYAGRITKLSCIASAVDEINERRREDIQVSKTFNIFKNDIFFSDLSV